MKRAAPYIIIVLLIGFGIILLRNQEPDVVYIEKEPQVFIDSFPVPADTVKLIIPLEVDTAEILQRYYTRLTYYDTVLTTDSIRVVISEVVQENSVIERITEVTPLKWPQMISQTKNTIGVGYGNHGFKAYYTRNFYKGLFIGGGIERNGVFVLLDYRF